MMYFTRTCVLLVAVLGVNSVLAQLETLSSGTIGQSMFIGRIGSSSGGKIVGGTNAAIANFPYQLSLRRGKSHTCGGSLISPLWALSAAHCADYPATEYIVFAGTARLATGGISRPVVQKFVHENWNRPTIDYDVALFKLATPFPLSATIAVIKLHAAGALVPHNTASTASGWGSMIYGGCLPNDLQTITVPALNTTWCQFIWKQLGNTTITPRMLCAGGTPEGGKGSCPGDSGGPLTAVVAGVKTLIGIVSFVIPCAYSNIPDVYTRVADVRGWINKTSGI